MSKSPFDIFDAGPPAAPVPADVPEPPRAVAAEPYAKLKRNLDLALDVHKQALSASLPDVPASDKRLMVESAHATVKALATDRTAVKARQENTLELVMLRVLFARKRHGYASKPEDEEKLRTAPRTKLETSLGARGLAEYDALKW
jgi:hypothetical protein